MDIVSDTLNFILYTLRASVCATPFSRMNDFQHVGSSTIPYYFERHKDLVLVAYY